MTIYHTIYHTIYQTTNMVTGKTYIGVHSTKNIHDMYIGSGKLIRKAKKKYGIKNFKKEILYVFDTKEEAYAKEAELVNEDVVNDHNTYNLTLGGVGSWRPSVQAKEKHFLWGKKHSTESKKRMSESHSKKTLSENHKKNIGKASKKLASKIHYKVECPHCGKVGEKIAMHRWHFDNCRN
jgi:hypothetical protein